MPRYRVTQRIHIGGQTREVGEVVHLSSAPDPHDLSCLEPLDAPIIEDIERENLEQVVEGLRSALSTAERSLGSARRDRDRLAAERDEARREVDRLVIELATVQEQCEALSAGLAEAEATNARLAAAKPWAEAHPSTVRAFANAQRTERGEEPFEGAGSAANARVWLDENAEALAPLWTDKGGEG